MRFLLLLLLLPIFCGCRNEISDYNFRYGTKLAIQQDSLITKYRKGELLSNQEIKKMEKNLWVWTSLELAPNNLVLRQFCLIDIFKKTPKYKTVIEKILSCLSYNGKIWAEGYSYWIYTRDILDEWIKEFRMDTDINNIAKIVVTVDENFVKTAYQRGTYWYPAPFGDLRNNPLIPDLQSRCNLINRPEIQTVYFDSGYIKYELKADTLKYYINCKPIGLNLHIPKTPDTVKILNGMPLNFDFYTGYDNKYTSSLEETQDLFDEKRINSLENINSY